MGAGDRPGAGRPGVGAGRRRRGARLGAARAARQRARPRRDRCLRGAGPGPAADRPRGRGGDDRGQAVSGAGGRGLFAASSGGAEAPWSVGQLAAAIEGALAARVPASVRVIGEVSNLSVRTHWYFAIKDPQVGGALVQCVLFAGRAKAAPRIAEGQRVIVTGRVEYYKPQGRVSVYVERVEAAGAGALEARLRALVEELRGLGWLEPSRKRAVPAFPRRVAVITSRGGAALQDVLDTMRRRCPAVEVCLLDVLVQGPQAAGAVANAVRWVSAGARKLGIDAVLVTRGGGSLEDLWAFNEREVAGAIVSCSVPVVAAIGHETDVTVAELVADERCATPTQAAMRLTPDREALGEQVEEHAARWRAAWRARLAAERGWAADSAGRLGAACGRRGAVEGLALERLRAGLGRVRPVALIRARGERLSAQRQRLAGAGVAAAAQLGAALDRLWERVVAAGRGAVHERAGGLESARRQLELVGPQRVLMRGYSITLDGSGRAVRSVRGVIPGDVVTTRLADGGFESVVGRGVAGAPEPAAAEPAEAVGGEAPARAGRAARRQQGGGPAKRGGGAAPQRGDEPGLFGG
ncbi:MAG: exodeoxyribonuclease VII large subunit [Isosphaera sp.]|nr:exodeoxyribonuclease VII large subunit [Isosphaera sp.]